MLKKHKSTLGSFIKKGSIVFDALLKNKTTLKIGGNAQVYIQTSDADEIIHILKYAKTNNISIFIIGGGSNVVFRSSGYDGIILHLGVQSPVIKKISFNSANVTFTAGYLSHLAAQKMADFELTGFEYMYGLPGTIGGAVYMNSKWPKDSFMTCQPLVKVKYISENLKLVETKAGSLDFSYGYSEFQKMNGIIVSATFNFKKGVKSDIEKKHREVMSYRKQTQPIGVFTAGCIFKNITEKEKNKIKAPTSSAGYLIDKSGMKGYVHNDLRVSPVHANFFENRGNATSDDYEYLVNKVRKKVYNKFGVYLQEEVLFI